jgi:hypothetical protein
MKAIPIVIIAGIGAGYINHIKTSLRDAELRNDLLIRKIIYANPARHDLLVKWSSAVPRIQDEEWADEEFASSLEKSILHDITTIENFLTNPSPLFYVTPNYNNNLGVCDTLKHEPGTLFDSSFKKFTMTGHERT